MYKRILLAYDGSDAGQKALLSSHELALKLPAPSDSKLTVPVGALAAPA